MEDIGSVHLRLKVPGENETSVRLIRADVQIDGSTIFISFTASDDWPFVIENQSDYAVKMSQDARVGFSQLQPFSLYQ